MEYEVRRLPKKTIAWIIGVIIVGIVYFIISTNLRADKITQELAKVGFDNVTDVIIYGKHKMQDQKSKVQGYQYSVSFKDLNTNKNCKGFLLLNFDKSIHKDIECK